MTRLAAAHLKRAETRLRELLKAVEERERRIEALSRRLEQSFATLLSIVGRLESIEGEVRERLRERVEDAQRELFAIANSLDALHEEIERNKELLQRMLALVELLKERGKGL